VLLGPRKKIQVCSDEPDFITMTPAPKAPPDIRRALVVLMSPIVLSASAEMGIQPP
jgi:hypothetical protein